mmetsp:Transcript_28621/g.60400  ORF Transcript_28621/g.60400 Transcript_28621/m.60400 type:complete len:271 (+) Transcript_28621:321-1133(+)
MNVPTLRRLSKILGGKCIVHRTSLSIPMTAPQIVRRTDVSLLGSALVPNPGQRLIVSKPVHSGIVPPSQVVHGIGVSPQCARQQLLLRSHGARVGNVRAAERTRIDPSANLNVALSADPGTATSHDHRVRSFHVGVETNGAFPQCLVARGLCHIVVHFPLNLQVISRYIQYLSPFRIRSRVVHEFDRTSSTVGIHVSDGAVLPVEVAALVGDAGFAAGLDERSAAGGAAAIPHPAIVLLEPRAYGLDHFLDCRFGTAAWHGVGSIERRRG